MNRTTSTNTTTQCKHSKKVFLRFITWSVRGWGSWHYNIKQKMSKVKSELEGYNIVILVETHLSWEIDDIEKFEKYMEEFNLHHVHDKHRTGGRKGGFNRHLEIHNRHKWHNFHIRWRGGRRGQVNSNHHTWCTGQTANSMGYLQTHTSKWETRLANQPWIQTTQSRCVHGTRGGL